MSRMKVSIMIVVFFIGFNAFVGFLNASGYTDAVGLDTEVNEPEELETAESEARNVQTGGGGLETLFGLWSLLAGFVSTFHDALLPGMALLSDVGVPTEIIGLVDTSVAFIAGRDLIDFLRSG